MSLDTSRARTAILERIRRQQGRDAKARPREEAAAEAYVAAHPAGPRPTVPEHLERHFVEQAERMASTVDVVETLAEAPAAIARYLEAQKLPPRAIAWTTLADLPWPGAGLAVEHRPPVDADLVGITGVFCAVAETGSLVCLSGPDTFASATLLPETHVAIVPRSRIVKGMEDVWALVRAERGELPRATSFISGPSRTGDIEQTIVLGAHGPYRVHILVVRGA